MLAPLQASILGAPPPPFSPNSPIQSSNQVMGEVTGAGPLGQVPMQSGLSTPLTPPKPPAPSPLAAAETPPAPAESGLSQAKPFRSKYDEIFDKAEGLLTDTLQKKQGIDPVALAMIQGFLAPTKTGSFGEQLGMVAGNVRQAQNEIGKEDVSRLQAQMSLASAGSQRARDEEAQRLTGMLYSKTPEGLKINPEIAQQLSAITKDPRFVQQAIAEEQQASMKKVGMNMFKQKVIPGKEGEPGQTVLEFNPNAIYDMLKISSNPIKDISEYAKMIPELRKSGLIDGLKEVGSPFDALVLMAPSDAIKQQAKYLADQYSRGRIDPDKAISMANSMLTMAQAHMDKEEMMKFHQGTQAIMMSMKQDSMQLMRDKFNEQQKENEKKYSDKEKMLYKNSVLPIINEGQKASEALTALSQLQDVAAKAPSGVFAGGMANSVGALFGSDDATSMRNLTAMSRSLITKIPRLPGAQSNMDAKNLLESIGRLEDPMLTNKQRVDIIHNVAKGFQALQTRADEVSDTWDSTRKLPTWATPTNLGLTPTPAPAPNTPIGSGNFVIKDGKLVPAP